MGFEPTTLCLGSEPVFVPPKTLRSGSKSPNFAPAARSRQRVGSGTSFQFGCRISGLDPDANVAGSLDDQAQLGGCALTSISRFEVRLGRLQHQGTRSDGSSIFGQKRVDLHLGLDIALLSGKQQDDPRDIGRRRWRPRPRRRTREAGRRVAVALSRSLGCGRQSDGHVLPRTLAGRRWTARDRSGILGPSAAPVLTTFRVGCVGSTVGVASRSKSASCLSRGKQASAMRCSRRRAPRSSSSAESSSAR